MARIKVVTSFPFCMWFLAFVSTESNSGKSHEIEPRLQEPPVTPFVPGWREGRLFGAVRSIALRKQYLERLDPMEETIKELEESEKAEMKKVEDLLLRIQGIEAKILLLLQKECEPPKHHYKGRPPYQSPTPILIYANNPSKGHYGDYEESKPAVFYPVKGHYEETDYSPPKNGHYEGDDYYPSEKGHYEKSDDYDKPKGHYGKSEPQTNNSSKTEDKKPTVNPPQKSSEGKSFVDNRFDGYDRYAQQQDDTYNHYYASRYQNDKEIKNESKNIQESKAEIVLEF